MTSNRPETKPCEFAPDELVVVLYEGRFCGRFGRFLGLRVDPNWADIQERDGVIRSHPVLWLRHSATFLSPGGVAARGIQPVRTAGALSKKGGPSDVLLGS